MVTKTTKSAIDAYVESTILLVRSLVIKSTISALRCNQNIVAKYGSTAVDQDRPKTWKYYMNLAGQYHPTDTVMKVISLDTQEEIEFTPANLKIHTATAENYRYGTRFYFSLCAKYPSQVDLILSIGNPADIDKAIAAKDGTVLAYYQHLVEEQESTLINDIEEYAKNFLARYTVIGFNHAWRTYPTLSLGALYASLVAHIMDLRLLSAKTERAHSFHIRQYLASHGGLDEFIPYMTLKQMLYLYHNIDYLQKHAGHQSTFKELVQWLLSDRRIPLSKYTIRQLQQHDENLYPLLKAHRVPVGTRQNLVEAEYIPVEELYSKEIPTQRGNKEFYTHNTSDTSSAFANSPSSVVQTKDLESAMIDYSDSVPDTLEEVLLRQWAAMAEHGLYKVLVNFNHIQTGERMSMLADKALVYYSYIMLKGLGVDVKYVPDFSNVKFRIHPRPNVNDLYKDLIPSEFPELKEIAEDLVAAQPTIVECRSVSAFWDLTYQIYQECLRHWYIKGYTHDPMKRGVIAKMISRLFGITVIRSAPDNTLMSQWLADNALPEFEGTYEEAKAFAFVIFQAATGLKVDETKTLESIQRAMVNVFRKLSSYSIQIMREINNSSVIPLAGASVRVGVKGQDAQDKVHVPGPIRVLDSKLDGQDLRYVNEVGLSFVTQDITDQPNQEVQIRASTDVAVVASDGETDTMVINCQVTIPRIVVSDDSSKISNTGNFHNIELYEALTDGQIKTIADFLNSRK